jgi:hypothetical protein
MLIFERDSNVNAVRRALKSSVRRVGSALEIKRRQRLERGGY